MVSTSGFFFGESHAAAAKSLQSCPTLCDRTDSSPAGSSVHGGIPQSCSVVPAGLRRSEGCAAEGQGPGGKLFLLAVLFGRVGRPRRGAQGAEAPPAFKSAPRENSQPLPRVRPGSPAARPERPARGGRARTSGRPKATSGTLTPAPSCSRSGVVQKPKRRGCRGCSSSLQPRQLGSRLGRRPRRGRAGRAAEAEFGGPAAAAGWAQAPRATRRGCGRGAGVMEAGWSWRQVRAGTRGGGGRAAGAAPRRVTEPAPPRGTLQPRSPAGGGGAGGRRARFLGGGARRLGGA